MNHNFKNLVFEGGGVKGIAYGGALKIIDSMNILSGIERVAGTSAGAITACLLAVGYSADDVSKIVASTDFNSFKDKTWLPGNLCRFFRKYGYYIGDTFLDLLGKLIEAKTDNKDFTFGDLERDKEKKGYKELFVVVTNLTKQKVQVLSHEHDKDLPIRIAVRMSMSIPLFFKAYNWKNNIMVDGGVSWQYAGAHSRITAGASGEAVCGTLPDFKWG